MTADPNSGTYRDEFAGTYVYEDTGKTLADESPEYHFQVPLWSAWLVQLTGWFHSRAQRIAGKYRVVV